MFVKLGKWEPAPLLYYRLAVYYPGEGWLWGCDPVFSYALARTLQDQVFYDVPTERMRIVGPGTLERLEELRGYLDKASAEVPYQPMPEEEKRLVFYRYLVQCGRLGSYDQAPETDFYALLP